MHHEREERKYIEREREVPNMINPDAPPKIETYLELDPPLEEYWDRMKKTGAGGRPKKLSSPLVLWEHCCDYFKLCDKTPWRKVDYKGKDVEKVEIPTTRPYTWGGLDEYLKSKDIIAKLEDYKANKPNDDGSAGPYEEFSEVISRVRNIIRTQKLEGALVGAFDPRIVAAELKLTQKVEVTTPKQVFKIGGVEIEIG